MRIGVIGGGNVGTALAKRLTPHGHDVMLSYSREPDKLGQAAVAFGARIGTVTEAVGFAEVVALAVPWAAVPDAIVQSGPGLSGKVLWDCTNALKPDLSGMAISTTTSGGEEVAKLAPGARVVKGIPPFAELMHSDDPTVGGRPVGLFVAGDDDAAKQVVAGLMQALPSEVTDAGGLEAARLIEPAMMLLVRLAYGMGLGSRIALNLVH